MSASTRILVTGYAAFPGELNASQILIESCQAQLPIELLPYAAQLHFAVLQQDTKLLWPTVQQLIAHNKPHYCVFTGQAPGRNAINLERFAINWKQIGPTVNNRPPVGETILADGPTGVFSTLPRQLEMVDALCNAGIPAAISNHGGTNLCNQILYQSVHYAPQFHPVPQTGFFHIPALPQQVLTQWPQHPAMELATTRRALTQVLTMLLQ